MISDIFVNYNTITKEITCAGIKISDVKTRSIKLTKVKSSITRIEENAFIQFNDTKCNVSILYKAHRFLTHGIISLYRC